MRLLLTDEDEQTNVTIIDITTEQRDQLVQRGLIRQCTSDCDLYNEDKPQLTYHFAQEVQRG